ncbi:multidrug efflux system outer membrane protein [Sediminitomix flava]|uniref:Multidrug efflux system outer membrane protein n=2 Tax=Sediminitomix flava TaxID=379075 RepID=A0A316A4Z0_SEDFL|nr:multidrug efflux system outer membrane protein [Sediminitomix flava]
MFSKPYNGTPVLTPDAYRFSDIQEVEKERLKTEEEEEYQLLSWWEIFNDSYLDTLIVTALRNNRNVLIASQRIEQARKQQSITKKDLRPKFGTQLQAGRGNFVQGLPGDDAFNLYTGFVSTSWELDIWGKFRSLNRAAKANLLGSEYAKRAIQISLISDVATSYFKLLELRELLRISESTLSSRDSSTNLIQQRFDKGIVAEIDLNQSQIQKAIAAGAVPLYKRQMYQQENALSILIGENPRGFLPEFELYEQEVMIDIPEGLPSELLSQRPDILQAEQQIVAQNYQIGVAKANRIPAISLTGLLGLASTELSSITDSWPAWNILGDFTGPIFQWGQLKDQVRIEEYRLQETILNYEQNVLVAFQEVEDALIGIETLKDEVRAREDHVRAASNAEMLSRFRYDKGVTSYLEFLESQRQAFDASLSLAQTKQQLLSNYVLLYKALGGGWISPEEKSEAEQAAQENTKE